MRVLACLVAVCLLAGVGEAPAAESMKPNIIFILTDDMGYGDVTAFANRVGVPTPNIDRLAKEGAKFTQYYTAAPICSPARSAIMTGQVAGRNHLNSYLQTRAGNRNVDQNDWLDSAVSVLPRAMKAAGYKTAHFGKWHLGGGRDVHEAPHLDKYGYDEYASTWESPEPHPDLGVKWPPWDRRLEPNQVPRFKRTEYMVNRTLEFLRKNKGEPCFINLWPDDVHTPHRPNADMARKYGADPLDEKKTPKKSFMAVLDEYDHQIGRLLYGLKEMGQEDNTIVIFTSDNGPEPHFQHERTGGLRGMKLSLYEGGLRMPFLVRWPGHVPAGYVDSTSVISAFDMSLTLRRLAGIDVPQNEIAAMDGVDVSAVLLGKPAKRDKALLWEYGRKKFGYGYPGHPEDKSPNLAIRDGDWKLLVNDDGTSPELYNIPADANETKNVAAEHKPLVDNLASTVTAWRKTLPGRNQPGETTLAKTLPNVVLIVADDLGYADLSCQGSKQVKTPSIDWLANEGVRFTNGYVTCPVCAPTRAGMLTGRYQQRFGFETNNGPEVIAVPQYGVPRSERMMPEMLKAAGYKTGMVGKWHLGFKPELTPPQRGFDFFFGFHSGYHGYFPDNPAPWSGPIMRNDQPVEEKEYLTDAFAREAVNFIKENANQPFFLYLPFNAVHAPLQAPSEFEKQFADVQNPKRRTMLAMITAMDNAVGKVLQTIHDEFIFDGTIVIFLSDNGGAQGLKESSNDPLRGHKGQVFEGGIRVPMIIQWWGHIPQGKVYDLPVNSLDILPTVLAAAGIEAPGNLDGVNLLPYIRGEKSSAPHEELYWRFYDGPKRRAIRRGDMKLLSEGGPWQLYNLANDIGEKNDLATSSPDTVKSMEAAWDKWNQQMQDPKWQGQAPPPGPDPSQKRL